MAADSSGLTPLNLACDSNCKEAVAVPQSAESSSRVPEGLAEEHLNTQRAELSDYFASRYLDGDLYDGRCYSMRCVEEIVTYKYKASDGVVMVWRHAFDLRAFGQQGEEVVVLYHYTDELAFLNIGNLQQTEAQLLASLEDDRAHFGQGIYATQHEPAVWGSRLRILLNSYSNGDPFSPTPDEAQKRNAQWGTGRGESGHRAAFCIPLIVPRSIAYNIFERQTPDMAERTVTDCCWCKRPIKLGQDYLGRAVHRHRDVWVIRVETDGRVQHAAADADAVLDLLQLRLRKLRATTGEDVLTAECMEELAGRLDGRGRYREAEKPEELYRECLRIRRAKLGEDHPDTLNSLNNLALLLKDQGDLPESKRLLREALEKSKSKLGEDHPDTLGSLSNFALLLKDQGDLPEAERLLREALEKSTAKLGEDHLQTLGSLNNLASLLKAQERLAEAEPLYQKALDKSTAKLGEDHPQTLGTLSNFAALLDAQGHLPEAEDLFREALGTSRAKLGEDHPQTLVSLNNLASLLQAQGRLAEAEPLYHVALEKSRAKLGKDHPQTLGSLNNMAFLLQGQGRLVEAEPLYREALQKRRRKLGNQHTSTMKSICNLGVLLKSMEMFEEAEKLFREHLAACMARQDHQLTGASREYLAEFLEERGKADEAQELRHLAGQTAQ